MQIPVYVWAPEEEGQFQAGRCSRWWIHNSLAALEKDLQALGSRLIFLRASESTTALTRLLTESKAQVKPASVLLRQGLLHLQCLKDIQDAQRMSQRIMMRELSRYASSSATSPTS